MPPHSFRKQERLCSKKDFDRIFGLRCSVADRLLIVYGYLNGLDFTRVGFGVSKKVGSAVVRNRFRRIYREAFRLIKAELPMGLDLVIVPRSLEEPKLEEVKDALRRLVPLVESKLRWGEGKA